MIVFFSASLQKRNDAAQIHVINQGTLFHMHKTVLSMSFRDACWYITTSISCMWMHGVLVCNSTQVSILVMMQTTKAYYASRSCSNNNNNNNNNNSMFADRIVVVGSTKPHPTIKADYSISPPRLPQPLESANE